MKKATIAIIPICVLLVLSIGRLITSDAIKSVKQRDAEVQRMFRKAIAEKERDKLFIKHLLYERGPVFLYTNDSLATAGWVPNIAASDIGGVTYMPVEIMNYRAFAEKYDSLGFTILLNHNNKFYYRINADSVSYNDFRKVPKKHFYFMAYDSKGNLFKDSASLKKYPAMRTQKFVTTWSVGFTDERNLTPDSLECYHFYICAPSLKQRRGFFLYMAGVAKDNRRPGVDSAGFFRSVLVVNKLLHNEGIDTAGFRVRVFRNPAG